ncbi:MAG: dockerin type I repeat-containing protein [Ruminococcus sp.]|nr:dockerin type I repeat-containing protein [Ruminococcus sp.]
MNRKLIAMISALIMCSSAVPYTASAEEVTENMPEWIPQNFTEAMDFDNTYGKTHIEDGLICCVRRCYNSDDSNEYVTEYSDGSYFELLMNETYSFKLPEKPDESDTEAYQEYLDFLHSNGINEFYTENVYVDYNYEVTVYSLKPSESVEINWIQKHPQTKEIINTTTLSFEASADGEITETDLYGWLPDSMSEGADYVRNNGEISIHDGYIVVCDEIVWDGGLSMVVESTGTADLELVKKEESNIKHIQPLGGGSKTEVQVYKPVTSGQVKVTFRNSQDWKNGFVSKIVVRYFNIDDDGNISETEGIYEGDCNGDGQFTISDVVMFQKWLSGKGELTDGKNADLTSDNKLDVFDLVLMKQLITNGGISHE